MNTELNKYQREAILQISIAKTDKFINLPTGFSKSLIYQALLLVCDIVHGTTGHYCCCCFAPGNSWKIKLQKLENIGIPSVTLSDISKENMRVVERGTFQKLG